MSKVKFILKFFSAGVVAFAILSTFSFLYYNVPIRMTSETNSTDYSWEKDNFFIRCTEGFSYGKIDSRGFNNLKALDDINVLILGSSQVEGFNVLPDENTVSVLNRLFASDLGYQAYNIGISGHTLEHCIQNLENAVEEFKPSDYIIIETQDLKFQPSAMEKVLNNSYERIASYNNGITYYFQKFDYLRLVYSQLQLYRQNHQAAGVTASTATPDSLDATEYEPLLDAFIQKAKNAAGDCKIIIFFAGAVKLDSNNTVKDINEDYYYTAFKKSCEKNDVIFIDMHDAFKELYLKDKVLPHGFSNTRVGHGHLNKYGHNAIAETLHTLILDLEEAQ